MGVLRQLAVAKSSPVTHTDRYRDAVWLGAAQQHCTVHALTEASAEVLRASWLQLESGAPPRELTRACGTSVRAPSGNDCARHSCGSSNSSLTCTEWRRTGLSRSSWSRPQVCCARPASGSGRPPGFPLDPRVPTLPKGVGRT